MADKARRLPGLATGRPWSGWQRMFCPTALCLPGARRRRHRRRLPQRFPCASLRQLSPLSRTPLPFQVSLRPYINRALASLGPKPQPVSNTTGTPQFWYRTTAATPARRCLTTRHFLVPLQQAGTFFSCSLQDRFALNDILTPLNFTLAMASSQFPGWTPGIVLGPVTLLPPDKRRQLLHGLPSRPQPQRHIPSPRRSFFGQRRLDHPSPFFRELPPIFGSPSNLP